MRDVVVSAGVALLLGACAQARQAQPSDADVGGPPIDGEIIEGPIDARPDSMTVMPPDAAPDAAPDAPPDAYQCTNVNMQLLANPAFDLDAGGTGWVQQPIDAAYPLITGDDGVAEHSAPYKVSLGGLEAIDYGVATVTDGVYQDVLIPVGTTQLTITGQYDVRTAETTATVYDSTALVLTQTNGTPIDTILTASNLTPKTAWTPFNKTFAMNLSGQTVRLRMTSTNDVSDATSFYFDTFALTATVCQ